LSAICVEGSEGVGPADVDDYDVGSAGKLDTLVLVSIASRSEAVAIVVASNGCRREHERREQCVLRRE
jgi:hypothetical protein